MARASPCCSINHFRYLGQSALLQQTCSCSLASATFRTPIDLVSYAASRELPADPDHLFASLLSMSELGSQMKSCLDA